VTGFIGIYKTRGQAQTNKAYSLSGQVQLFARDFNCVLASTNLEQQNDHWRECAVLANNTLRDIRVRNNLIKLIL
jgi:hypothetical protein